MDPKKLHALVATFEALGINTLEFITSLTTPHFVFQKEIEWCNNHLKFCDLQDEKEWHPNVERA